MRAEEKGKFWEGGCECDYQLVHLGFADSCGVLAGSTIVCTCGFIVSMAKTLREKGSNTCGVLHDLPSFVDVAIPGSHTMPTRQQRRLSGA